MHAQAVFTLRTGVAEGRLVFLGSGGEINGQVNPMLKVHEGETVQINLVNGEGAEHDIVIDQYGARSNRVVGKGASSSLSFTANKTGEFAYYCSVPGHRDAGMEGRIQVIPGPRAPAVAVAPDIVRDPSDLPPPIHTRPAEIVHVDLETVELMGQLDDKTTYNYWTFNGKVPGPFIRIRVGDTVEVRLKNPSGSVMIHSVDFHAATGPGGGAVFTQTDPGTEKTFTFKALVPGLFVYHCATPSVPNHIANGMYGMILVEPEGGLPQVDREFYIMQGELYTVQPFGTQGNQEMDYEKLISERPEYFLFNGSAGALMRAHPLRASARRNGPDILWRWRAELYFIVSHHWRDFRSCLSRRQPRIAAADRRANRFRSARRGCGRRFQDRETRAIHDRGPRLVAIGAGPCRILDRGGPLE